jgi:hypothetical protein
MIDFQVCKATDQSMFHHTGPEIRRKDSSRRRIQSADGECLQLKSKYRSMINLNGKNTHVDLRSGMTNGEFFVLSVIDSDIQG